jgi:hypothetical protein
MKMRPTLFASIALVAGSSIIHAQLPSCTEAVANTVTAVTAAKLTSGKDNQLQGISQALSRIEFFAACGTEATIVKNMEAKRTDIQTGAPASASGSNTAVASASKPNFLGLALENGTTTQTTSGTSSTVSINPWRFVDSIAHDENQTIDPNDAGSKLLRKFALSITLNPGSGSSSKQTSTTTNSGTNSTSTTTPTTLITQLKEVSDFTVHFDVHNDRDPMSSGAAKKIREMTVVPVGFFKSADVIGSFIKDDANQEAQVLVSFSGDLNAEVTRFINSENDKIAKNKAIVTAVGTFQQAASMLIKANQALYNGLAHSPTFSIEYSLDRQPMVQAMISGTGSATTATTSLMNTPDLHTARLIHAWGYYTVNASASFFGQKTAAMPDVWRDLQFGAKIDIPFSGIANVVNKGTFELSGLFVNLHQMPLGINLMVNGVSVTQPGKIGLFQAKYNIPTGNSSGFQVPISITYSNRTDLIKESSIQAGIGITWDMSKLVASKQAPSQ